MMGHDYETADGAKCEFLGAIDFHTAGGAKRMIGNYAYRLDEEDGAGTVVGFENHSGRTWLGGGVRPLGRVLKGYGNNGEDGTEGARFGKCLLHLQPRPCSAQKPRICGPADQDRAFEEVWLL